MMGKLPAFPLYASDFDMDTATWENDELGAYLRLLLYEWVNGGLPNDTYKLAKISRESQRKFIDKWKNLSNKFTLNGNGLLINQRMENVRQEKLYYIESQREKGIKSAKKRWEGHITRVKATVIKRLQPEDNLSSSSSSSSSNINKTLSQNFDKFWQAYPLRDGKRVTKKESLQYFKDNFKDEEVFQLLMKATLNYFESSKVKDGFAKDPIRFLKKDFWKDWIEGPVKPGDQYPHFEIVGAIKEPIKVKCNFCGEPYSVKEDHQCKNQEKGD